MEGFAGRDDEQRSSGDALALDAASSELAARHRRLVPYFDPDRVWRPNWKPRCAASAR